MATSIQDFIGIYGTAIRDNIPSRSIYNIIFNPTFTIMTIRILTGTYYEPRPFFPEDRFYAGLTVNTNPIIPTITYTNILFSNGILTGINNQISSQFVLSFDKTVLNVYTIRNNVESYIVYQRTTLVPPSTKNYNFPRNILTYYTEACINQYNTYMTELFNPKAIKNMRKKLRSLLCYGVFHEQKSKNIYKTLTTPGTTTILVKGKNKINSASNIKISGLKGEWKAMNGIHELSILGTTLSENYNNKDLEYTLLVLFDSSSLPQYNEEYYGVANITSCIKVDDDSEFKNILAAALELSRVGIISTHNPILSFSIPINNTIRSIENIEIDDLYKNRSDILLVDDELAYKKLIYEALILPPQLRKAPETFSEINTPFSSLFPRTLYNTNSYINSTYAYVNPELYATSAYDSYLHNNKYGINFWGYWPIDNNDPNMGLYKITLRNYLISAQTVYFNTSTERFFIDNYYTNVNNYLGNGTSNTSFRVPMFTLGHLKKNNKIGYISVVGFNPVVYTPNNQVLFEILFTNIFGYLDALQAAFKYLNKDGPLDKLIIDIRHNSGGIRGIQRAFGNFLGDNRVSGTSNQSPTNIQKTTFSPQYSFQLYSYPTITPVPEAIEQLPFMAQEQFGQDSVMRGTLNNPLKIIMLVTEEAQSAGVLAQLDNLGDFKDGKIGRYTHLELWGTNNPLSLGSSSLGRALVIPTNLQNPKIIAQLSNNTIPIPVAPFSSLFEYGLISNNFGSIITEDKKFMKPKNYLSSSWKVLEQDIMANISKKEPQLWKDSWIEAVLQYNKCFNP